MAGAYDFSMASISGDPVNLQSFENQVSLIVNVASE